MIRVKELQLNHVGPFKDQWFDFSINPGDPDIHIFTGVNGTGKTTVLHAIAAMFDFEDDHCAYIGNDFHRRFRENANLKLEHRFAEAKMVDIEEGQNEVVRCYHCQECGSIHLGFEKDADWEEGVIRVKNKVDGVRELNDAVEEQDIMARKPLQFAAFAYSPNRFLSSSQINIGLEHQFDPLREALKFSKSKESNSAFSTWIGAVVARHGVEIGNNNLELARRHKEPLDKLKKTINELIDDNFRNKKYDEKSLAFDFDIDTNPWGVTAKLYGQKVDFDVLPDGLRSIMSWMGDLLMRLDRIKWRNSDVPVNEQNFILLLDEIEVHLHPRWQYQLLPLIREIFPNAQIFLTTHSPFILNSIDGAKIHQLVVEKGEAKLDRVTISETGNSYPYVFKTVLGVTHEFGNETVRDLAEFEGLDKEIANRNFENEKRYIELTRKLMAESAEVANLVGPLVKRHVRISQRDYLNGSI